MVRADARRCTGYRRCRSSSTRTTTSTSTSRENNFAAAVGEYASWGYFDYPHEGRRLRRGLPERAGELGNQLGAETRFLPAADGDDGSLAHNASPVLIVEAYRTKRRELRNQ